MYEFDGHKYPAQLTDERREILFKLIDMQTAILRDMNLLDGPLADGVTSTAPYRMLEMARRSLIEMFGFSMAEVLYFESRLADYANAYVAWSRTWSEVIEPAAYWEHEMRACEAAQDAVATHEDHVAGDRAYADAIGGLGDGEHDGKRVRIADINECARSEAGVTGIVLHEDARGRFWLRADPGQGFGPMPAGPYRLDEIEFI
jgi:hypothetical protein